MLIKSMSIPKIYFGLKKLLELDDAITINIHSSPEFIHNGFLQLKVASGIQPIPELILVDETVLMCIDSSEHLISTVKLLIVDAPELDTFIDEKSKVKLQVHSLSSVADSAVLSTH